MAINWFPGHIHKARKEIKKTMSQIDIVIEILDARIPFSSANPLVNQLRGDKPCIKILNKSDLADPAMTETWQRYLEQDKKVKTLAICATQKNHTKTISHLCRKLVPEKIDSDKNLNAMIMGIPNVGKSTLINSIAGRSIAKVGNEPAVTKRQQKINLDNGISLSDTPGILWPKLEPEATGYRLAVTGAVKDTAMEYEDIALFAADYLYHAYPDELKERYKISELPPSDTNGLEEAMLELIGSKRGCLKAGGIVDTHQAATILIQDLRSGKLGGLTLETPEMTERELDELRAMIAAKRAAEEAAENGNEQTK